MRLRVPDWLSGLETELRKKLAARTARGNITLSLRLAREDTAGKLRLNEEQVSTVLDALVQIEAKAMERGLDLAPSRAAEIAALRGVFEVGSEEEDTATLCRKLLTEADVLIASFNTMREKEGAAVATLLASQLEEIEHLTHQARDLAAARSAEMAETLKRNLAKVLQNSDAMDEDRIAQELAVLAVKSDVTEEIDRLSAHVVAAGDLVAQGGAVGRKLDFLMQEFNREANTLCAKAQSTELTRCGLALKALIDQMREQVQNVE
jgi:uncharacterized protein (TIGR00255 family)